jgi:hypothetical protein
MSYQMRKMAACSEPKIGRTGQLRRFGNVLVSQHDIKYLVLFFDQSNASVPEMLWPSGHEPVLLPCCTKHWEQIHTRLLVICHCIIHLWWCSQVHSPCLLVQAVTGTILLYQLSICHSHGIKPMTSSSILRLITVLIMLASTANHLPLDSDAPYVFSLSLTTNHVISELCLSYAIMVWLWYAQLDLLYE